jgi:excinuclease ABC subunit C
MVVFYDGKPKKNDYRKFKMQTLTDEVGRPDDFASMREVIFRRYRKFAEKHLEEGFIPPLLPTSSPRGEEENDSPENIYNEPIDSKELPMPDLIVIDGGKGQLSSAVKVLTDLGIKHQNIIGLAKRLEEVFLPGFSDAQSIPKTSSGLKLLQRVRDEAHRFAITYHRKLRSKRTIHSELDEIKGIGEKTRQKLLTEFGSVDNIKQMLNDNYGEFEKRAGKKVAERLKEAFTNNK